MLLPQLGEQLRHRLTEPRRHQQLAERVGQLRVREVDAREPGGDPGGHREVGNEGLPDVTGDPAERQGLFVVGGGDLLRPMHRGEVRQRGGAEPGCHLPLLSEQGVVQVGDGDASPLVLPPEPTAGVDRSGRPPPRRVTGRVAVPADPVVRAVVHLGVLQVEDHEVRLGGAADVGDRDARAGDARPEAAGDLFDRTPAAGHFAAGVQLPADPVRRTHRPADLFH